MDRWKQKRTLEGMIKQLESQALRLRQLHAELFPEKETETESKETSPTPPKKKRKKKEKEDTPTPIVRVAVLTKTLRKELDEIHWPCAAQVQEVLDALKITSFSGLDFVSKYESQGWMLNGKPAKSWTALILRWKKNEGIDLKAKHLAEKYGQKSPATSPAFTASDAAASAARDEARQQREREQQERQAKSVSYEEYQRMKERGEIE